MSDDLEVADLRQVPERPARLADISRQNPFLGDIPYRGGEWSGRIFKRIEALRRRLPLPRIPSAAPHCMPLRMILF
jgi:hypothetical protein